MKAGTTTLSARSGEREGPNRDSDWEGEVFIRGTIVCAIKTHLTRSLTLAPSPPASKRAERFLYRLAFASWIARQTRSGVAGIST